MTTEAPRINEIDVERLAQALVTATREQAGEPYGKGWPGYIETRPRKLTVTLVVNDLAEAIAREYAALAAEPKP